MSPLAWLPAALIWLLAAAWPAVGAAADITVQADNARLAQHTRQSVAQLAPRLAQWTGASPRRIVVSVIADNDAFARRMEQLGAPAWADGLALPLRGEIVIKSPALLGGAEQFDHVLAHELMHLHLAPAMDGRRLPLWLEEGLAMILSGETAWGRAPTMAGGVLADQLPPLGELAASFPAEEGAAALAYAQSYYFVSWFLNNHGDAALRQVLTGLAQGLEPSAAFMVACGRSLAGLEKQFRQDMAERFSWLALLTAGGTLWALFSLLAGAGLVWRRGRQKARRQGMDESHWRALHGPGGRCWPPPEPRADVLGEAGQNAARPPGDGVDDQAL